jgi:hypothetical protein
MAKQKREIFVDKKVQARIDAKAKGVDPDEKDGESGTWSSSAVKLAYLLCDPTMLGATQEQLADKSGFSLRSVQRYMNEKPAFKKYAQEVAESVYGELYPIFVAAMKKGLEAGNSKFVELFMRSRGMLKEVRQVESKVEVTQTNASDDALEAEIARLEKTVHGDLN